MAAIKSFLQPGLETIENVDILMAFHPRMNGKGIREALVYLLVDGHSNGASAALAEVDAANLNRCFKTLDKTALNIDKFFEANYKRTIPVSQLSDNNDITNEQFLLAS